MQQDDKLKQGGSLLTNFYAPRLVHIIVAHAYLSHAVQTAGGVDLFAGGVGHRYSMKTSSADLGWSEIDVYGILCRLMVEKRRLLW